jgi:hypothetical protein
LLCFFKSILMLCDNSVENTHDSSSTCINIQGKRNLSR